MTPKRNKPKHLRHVFNDPPLLKRINLPLLPARLMIANLLPANVDAPDWGTPDATDTAEFAQFLNERFPREMFPEFRQKVDGPNLTQMAARKLGEQIVPAPRSKLSNYRYIVNTRRM